MNDAEIRPSAQHAPLSTLRARYGIPPLTNLAPRSSALILVDCQNEFVDGGLRIPDVACAVERARELLRSARASGWCLFHVRHIAARPDSPLFAPNTAGVEFIAPLAPLAGEEVITKSIAGALTRTPLHERLQARRVDTLVVAGFMTHLAVDSTVRDAAVLGYKVIVAADATATRDLPGAACDCVVDHRTLQRAALAALGDRFADVMRVDEILSLPVGVQ